MSRVLKIGKRPYLLALGFIFLCVIATGCPDSKEEPIMSEKEAVKIATQKAEELDYIVENMNIKTKKTNSEIVVYFYPKQVEGSFISGGDLTITIDTST